MDDDERQKLIEIFTYLGFVHGDQESVLQRISDIYSETLYTDAMPQVREAVEIYLNALTQLRRANLNLMMVYDMVIDKLNK